MLVRALAFFWR